MIFTVVKHLSDRFPHEFPCVVLQRDNWDDYLFKTTFRPIVWLTPKKKIELGDVKILREDQEKGATELPDKFKNLGEQYCSLGQSLSYYELLFKLGKDVYRKILKGLRDVVFDEVRRARFEHHRGFQDSLLRSDSARRALEDARPLFAGADTRASSGESLSFTFQSLVHGNATVVPFRFESTGELPGRVNVIIGYNGSGKTQLLANIAMVASRPRAERQELALTAGRFVINPLVSFGAVIVISYSAFDTFAIPGRDRIARARVVKTGELFGYVYCGLRRFARNQSHSLPPRGLKSIDEVTEEFRKATDLATKKDRRRQFIRALRPLLREPSFQRIGLLSEFSLGSKEWTNLFSTLSSGHKIALNVIAQLTAHIQKRSLVLFDEPEAHLHPSLLAALVKGLRYILAEFESVAVIATHSPVVLQETPSVHVKILRRFDNRTAVDNPTLETFGETFGTLVSEVFDMNSDETDYHSALRRLARNYTIEEIQDDLGLKLGLNARSYLLSVGSPRKRRK
jgi:predicted ATPase